MNLTDYAVDDVITLVRRPVIPEGGEEYQEIGIRSFGNGIFHKEPVDGHEIAAKKVFSVEPGDLVFSNVFAWEGAVALAADSEKGMIGSHRFMTYRVNEEIADVRYLLPYFYGGPGLDVIRQASPGSAGRNRTLGIKAFGAKRVTLPDLAEQRRVADRLDAAMGTRNRLHAKISDRANLVRSTLDSLEEYVFEDCLARGWRMGPMHSLAEVNPKTERPTETENVAFVPMAALSDFKGEIDGATYKVAGDVGAGYKLFRRGDVVFARITPCMQNGKSAIFQNDSVVHGFGSTEFHVIRAHAEGDNRWIHRVVRSRRFRDAALPFMTGTAGQQRVPARYLQKVEIPIPPSSEERDSALEVLDRIHEQRVRFRGLHIQEVGGVKSLRSALLDAAFSGRM